MKGRTSGFRQFRRFQMIHKKCPGPMGFLDIYIYKSIPVSESAANLTRVPGVRVPEEKDSEIENVPNW